MHTYDKAIHNQAIVPSEGNVVIPNPRISSRQNIENNQRCDKIASTSK